MNKVIVAGAGNWGKNLIKNFHDLNALAGVAEMHPGLRQEIQKNYAVPVYKDIPEALPHASALVIATPASSHYDYAKLALETGKDVFIEKPMTLNSVEALELAQLAEAKEKILMVGHLLLYQPAITWIRDYLQKGQAGQVWHIATRRAKLGKVRSEENVWWSFAPHDVSVVLELLGRPQLKHVKAQGKAAVQPLIEDNVDVLLKFTSGQTAHIHSSWYWPTNERCTTILAEKKMIVYDEINQSVTVFDKGIYPDLSNREGPSFQAEVSKEQPLRLECEHFLNCLSTREKPRSDAWNGLAVVEILEKAHQEMKRNSQ